MFSTISIRAQPLRRLISSASESCASLKLLHPMACARPDATTSCSAWSVSSSGTSSSQ